MNYNKQINKPINNKPINKPINKLINNKSINKSINNKLINSSKNSYEKISFSNKIKKINFNKKKIIILIILTIILILLIVLVIYLIKYLTSKCYKKHSFFDYLKNGNFNNVCLIKDKPIQEKKQNNSLNNSLNNHKNEVFHISNQDYTYNQAKCKCNAYGARLAKESEIIDAYNKGAHWCNYGWSEGQNAFYPVQQNLWKKSKLFCGKKYGVNGGFFSNPLLKFGVNCYGKKPQGKIIKEKIPEENETIQDFCSLPKNNQSSQKLDSDIISPFNNNKWSNYY